eukprot:3100916-Rhodomonas_salina.2
MANVGRAAQTAEREQLDIPLVKWLVFIYTVHPERPSVSRSTLARGLIASVVEMSESKSYSKIIEGLLAARRGASSTVGQALSILRDPRQQTPALLLRCTVIGQATDADTASPRRQKLAAASSPPTVLARSMRQCPFWLPARHRRQDDASLAIRFSPITFPPHRDPIPNFAPPARPQCLTRRVNAIKLNPPQVQRAVKSPLIFALSRWIRVSGQHNSQSSPMTVFFSSQRCMGRTGSQGRVVVQRHWGGWRVVDARCTHCKLSRLHLAIAVEYHGRVLPRFGMVGFRGEFLIVSFKSPSGCRHLGHRGGLWNTFECRDDSNSLLRNGTDSRIHRRGLVRLRVELGVRRRFCRLWTKQWRLSLGRV